MDTSSPLCLEASKSAGLVGLPSEVALKSGPLPQPLPPRHQSQPLKLLPISAASQLEQAATLPRATRSCCLLKNSVRDFALLLPNLCVLLRPQPGILGPPQPGPGRLPRCPTLPAISLDLSSGLCSQYSLPGLPSSFEFPTSRKPSWVCSGGVTALLGLPRVLPQCVPPGFLCLPALSLLQGHLLTPLGEELLRTSTLDSDRLKFKSGFVPC